MAFNFYLNFIFIFTFDFTNLKFNSLIGAVLKSNDLIEQIRKYGLQSAVLCLILLIWNFICQLESSKTSSNKKNVKILIEI